MALESVGRFRIVKHRDPFLAAWTRFRIRRAALSIGVAALFVVGAPLAGLEIAPVGLEAAYVFLSLIFSVPVAVGLLTAIPPFECPACELPYSRTTRRELAAARNCAHCGIEKGTPDNSHY